MWWNRKLKAQIKDLEKANMKLTKINEEVIQYNEEIADKLQYMLDTFPFTMGDVVYDVQLRSNKGRFTKTKASRGYSTISEVVVDKKNYFNLVERYTKNDIFRSKIEAEKYLDEICID